MNTLKILKAMKLKIKTSDILNFLIIKIFSIISFILILQGCGNEIIDTNNSDLINSEILNSREFEDLIIANVDLFSAASKAISAMEDSSFIKKMKVGNTPEGIPYRYASFSVNPTLTKNISAKKQAFLAKYPSYRNFSEAQRKNYVKKALYNSSKLMDYIAVKVCGNKRSTLLRLKSGLTEGIYTYSNLMEGFTAAMDYSCESQLECGGYVLADGRVILSIQADATHSHQDYPDANVTYVCNSDGTQTAYYEGYPIAKTFHSHFNGSSFSSLDNQTQSNYYPDIPMVVLYNNSIYEYNYMYGYYIP